MKCAQKLVLEDFVCWNENVKSLYLHSLSIESEANINCCQYILLNNRSVFHLTDQKFVLYSSFGAHPGERDKLPIVHEAGWATVPVWTGTENLAPTGIRSPDRPARNGSLYQVR